MRPENIFDPIVAGSHACRLMVKLFICFLFKYDDEQCNKYYVCILGVSPKLAELAETASWADSGQLQFWSEPSEILNLRSCSL